MRLLEELLRRHTTADVDRALSTLGFDLRDGVLTISRDGQEPLFVGSDSDSRATVVRIAPGVYAQTPTENARVRLLARAALIAAQEARIEVHAPIANDGTYRGRLAFDLPRRIARAIGVRGSEPGDRFGQQYTHAFFDDEALIVEAAQAGLAFVVRRGAWIVLQRRPSSFSSKQDETDSFVREAARVVKIAFEVERQRLRETPQRAIEVMRACGRRTTTARGAMGRARLRRAVGWVDVLLFAGAAGPNCFRRTLMEIALDRSAAEETLVFGLDVGKTGHVAFKDAEDRTFDVAFEFPPV